MSDVKHSIAEVLKEGREILKNADVDEREARLLLAHALNISLTELIIKDECSEEEYKKYIEYVCERAKHTPFAYIVGYKEFMKLKFKVNKNVLIPREDTEVLVNKVIEIANNEYKDANSINILDMCTGSGAIAISLAKYILNSKVDAVDISKEALDIANENAKSNDVKVDFYLSNLFEKFNINRSLGIEKRYDIIVSNPPYCERHIIPLFDEDVKREPYIAFDGGDDGLDFYKQIINESSNYLNDNGYLAFEIGYNQGIAVKTLMENAGYREVFVIKDFSNKDRVVIGKYIFKTKGE